jgi:hypothetical protein
MRLRNQIKSSMNESGHFIYNDNKQRNDINMNENKYA